MQRWDVIIIGAGAAGLFCAIEAGKRGRKVLVIDHANKPGKKILMSGGGRCNFTNYYASPGNFISQNPHFCKSALSRFTQWDFIELVKKYHIAFHEKTLGQLFCDQKSKAILEMLLAECAAAHVEIRLLTRVTEIKNPSAHQFILQTNSQSLQCQSLVIATGGLSIPTLGASGFGYEVAQQFGVRIQPTRAGLVPFTLSNQEKEILTSLAGISVFSEVKCQRQTFRENILFTHRGLSGPAILQISSYWFPGEEVLINLLPQINLSEILKKAQAADPLKNLKTILCDWLPKNLVHQLVDRDLHEKKLGACSYSSFEKIAAQLQEWCIKPTGTEGYKTAEVTLGGVDCNNLSSKTMEVIGVPGLFFIGEVVDVTGWLGGFNFQWAWSSGWAAGQYV